MKNARLIAIAEESAALKTHLEEKRTGEIRPWGFTGDWLIATVNSVPATTCPVIREQRNPL